MPARAQKHFDAVLSVASKVQGCVQVLPTPKDEADRGPFHREAKKSRAGERGLLILGNQ